MRLAILGSGPSWYLDDLTRAACGRHEIVSVSFRQLVSSCVGGCLSARGGGCDLRSFDAVLVRAMPPGSLEQIVFRMDVLGRLESQGLLVVNPPRALEAAVDKYLATAKLQAAGLPVPRTIVCQTADEALTAFAELGGDVVVKPLFGSEGRGIARVQDEAMAYRVCTTLASLQSVLYLQEFIAHPGYDFRLLVIGQQVLAMKRSHAADWRTNVARGATPSPFTPTPEMLQMARTAAECIGAPIAGVDLLPGPDGRLYVLEVNAVPGWKALSATLDVDVASIVLDWIAAQLERARP
jgi:RimK family alpha-L-glutamate ligase